MQRWVNDNIIHETEDNIWKRYPTHEVYNANLPKNGPILLPVKNRAAVENFSNISQRHNGPIAVIADHIFDEGDQV